MSKTTKPLDWPDRMPKLRCPWLGQTPPGHEPVEFCPELLATLRRVTGITFSPEGDEALLCLHTPDSTSGDLVWTRMSDGVWTQPEIAPFNSGEIDNDIVWSPDGRRVVWRSWRALPGNREPEKNLSLWAVDRTPDGWGEPFPVECGGKRQSPAYTGITSDGSLYFATKLSEDEYGIARALRSGGQYSSPEVVLRGAIRIGDACVAPDERFLIATCFGLSQYNGKASLMVSFRKPEGDWTPLLDLGPKINTDLVEYCPTLSADGRRLFFCRIDTADKSAPAHTYWIDTRFLDELGPSV